jgi:hypothetical protein
MDQDNEKSESEHFRHAANAVVEAIRREVSPRHLLSGSTVWPQGDPACAGFVSSRDSEKNEPV